MYPHVNVWGVWVKWDWVASRWCVGGRGQRAVRNQFTARNPPDPDLRERGNAERELFKIRWSGSRSSQFASCRPVGQLGQLGQVGQVLWVLLFHFFLHRLFCAKVWISSEFFNALATLAKLWILWIFIALSVQYSPAKNSRKNQFGIYIDCPSSEFLFPDNSSLSHFQQLFL